MKKNEVGKLLKGFVAMGHNQFGKGVKVVRSDNGLEFKSEPMKQFYFENGILHQQAVLIPRNKMVVWNVNTVTY